MYSYDFWKDGKRAAVTFSYDDGTIEDAHLVDIFNKYGLKGTFNLNSVNSERNYGKTVDFDKLNEVYKGHEIASHGYNHLAPIELDDYDIVQDVYRDRQTLEAKTGRIVRGYAYPFGAYGKHESDIIHSCGIVYARTTVSTGDYRPPQDFMKWDPTCHHLGAYNKVENWLGRINRPHNNHGLFYVWGHSYEFTLNNDWDKMEELCKKLGGYDFVWYATNMEIYEYRMAQRQLYFSADRKTAVNPTSIDVWVGINEQPIKIPAGSTVHFE